MFFLVYSLEYFVLVLFAFVVLSLVSSVLYQETGWEESLRNDLFCVEWDKKPETHSTQVDWYQTEQTVVKAKRVGL